MKLLLSTILFALALAPRAAAQGTRVETKVETRVSVHTQRDARGEERERHEASDEAQDNAGPIERTASADAQAVVSVCLASGDVLVRGWDRKEVRARAEGAGSLRLLTPNVQPAPRVEVLISAASDDEPGPGGCGSASQVELMVPRGAAVRVSSHSGHVDVSDISEARVEALSGDVDVRRVAKSVEVSCLSGDISLADANGPVRLVTVSGGVEVRNARPASAGDGFEAKSTSGDVTIENVAHSQVISSTVSGSVLYTGALARGGAYDFKTISGDVTLELPEGSSFKLHAKVVASGDIDTEFPVRTVAIGSGGAPAAPPQTPGVNGPLPPAGPREGPRPGRVRVPKAPEQARLDGTVGSGDATINLSSFSGSLHLRKR